MACATYRRLTYRPDPWPVNSACLICGEEIAAESTVWLWQKEIPSEQETTNPTPALPPSVNPVVYSHFACGSRAGGRFEAEE